MPLISFSIAYFFTALLLELFAQSTIGLYLSYTLKKLESIQLEKGRLVEDYYNSKESQDDYGKEKGVKGDYELAREKAENFKRMEPIYYAILVLFVGLLLSYSGLRMLSYFVDTTALEKPQISLFNFIDMILTAGALAGGSIAIKKIGIYLADFNSKIQKIILTKGKQSKH
ncbi:putative MotA/TolQ/ExbB proton channel domain-containing protein [Gammaproteobacteria bacterium]